LEKLASADAKGRGSPKTNPSGSSERESDHQDTHLSDPYNHEAYAESESQILDEAKDIATVGYVLMLVAIVFSPLILVAMILAYVKRSKVKGQWVYSHYGWQINTIWVALAASAVALVFFGIAATVAVTTRDQSDVLLPSILGIIGFVIMMITAVWYVYRAIFGLYRLHKGRPPNTFR